METVEINIVNAEEKHLYSITSLTRHFFPYTGFTFETIKERLASEKIFYFVALSEGHTVGFADIEIQEDGNAKILGLAVLKEMQGKGIGKKLLEKCLEFAKINNCPKAFLFVAQDNEIAIKLYNDFGFYKKGVLDKQLNNQTVLLYEKSL